MFEQVHFHTGESFFQGNTTGLQVQKYQFIIHKKSPKNSGLNEWAIVVELFDGVGLGLITGVSFVQFLDHIL